MCDRDLFKCYMIEYSYILTCNAKTKGENNARMLKPKPLIATWVTCASEQSISQTFQLFFSSISE